MTSAFIDSRGQKPEVLYRPFDEADFEAVARLFQDQWCTEIAEKAGRLASQIDLCGYLEQANWSLVAEKRSDGAGDQAPRLLGAALLSLRDRPRPGAAKWAARRESLLAQATADPALLAEVKADIDMLDEESQLGDEYAASGQMGAAAELKLLIVSNRAQGLGVGGRLFSAARAAAHEAAGGMFLITDDSCDFGFYEHKGLSRMVARPTQVTELACPQDPQDFNLYVYAEEAER